jgi:hypothetical protein
MPASARTSRNLIAAIAAIAMGSLVNSCARYTYSNPNTIGYTEATTLSSKHCEAYYSYYSPALYNKTPVQDLGQIYVPDMLNAKKICLATAKDRCSRALLPLLNLPESVAAQICTANGPGQITVNINSSVNSFTDSQFGTCGIPITCTNRCGCEKGYWSEGEYCVKIACDNCTPRPENNTSFLSSGYFFWEGQLRYRKRPACTWSYY